MLVLYPTNPYYTPPCPFPRWATWPIAHEAWMWLRPGWGTFLQCIWLIRFWGYEATWYLPGLWGIIHTHTYIHIEYIHIDYLYIYTHPRTYINPPNGQMIAAQHIGTPTNNHWPTRTARTGPIAWHPACRSSQGGWGFPSANFPVVYAYACKVLMSTGCQANALSPTTWRASRAPGHMARHKPT